MTPPFKPRPELPVDRGWAWLVMLGASINSLFCFCFLRSISILFMEFLDKFGESAAMTTLAFGLNTASYSVFSLLVPPLFLSRFSVRTVTLVGAFILAFSIIALAFAPNMTYIYILFITLGAAIPMIFVSQVDLLGIYFKKRLSLAVALANAGVSIATMVGPPLTRYMLDEYGLQGTLLIHGALNLHNVAACLLFRPPTFYAKPTSVCDSQERVDLPRDTQDGYEHVVKEPFQTNNDLVVSSSKLNCVEDNESINNFEIDPLLLKETSNGKNGDIQKISQHSSRKTKSLHDLHFIKFSDDVSQKSKDVRQCLDIGETKRSQTKSGSERNIDRSNSSLINKNILNIRAFHSPKNSGDVYVSNPSLTMDGNGITFPVLVDKHQHCCHKGDHDFEIESSLNNTNLKKEKKVPNGNSNHNCSKTFSKLDMKKSGPLSKSEQSIVFNTIADSSTSKIGEAEPEMVNGENCLSTFNSVSQESNSEVCFGSCDCNDCNRTGKTCCPVCVKSPNSSSSTSKSVLFHPLGIMLLLIAGIGINTQCAAAYMPSLGKEQGLTDEQAPLLMTVIGICDLFKLVIGYLADKGWVRRIHIVLVCQVLIGLVFQFVTYFRGFGAMVVLCVIFGSNTEVTHCLIPGITVDLLGVEFISKIISLYFLINGVVMSLTHVLIGWLKDETGSFIGGYHFMGGLILFSVVVVLLEPVFRLCIPSDSDGVKDTTHSRHRCHCSHEVRKNASDLSMNSNDGGKSERGTAKIVENADV